MKIHRCNVSGAVWTGLTGFGAGTGALSTTMPLVMIAHSSMTGAPNDTDNYYYKVPQSPVAVSTTGTLILVDSQANGAPGVPYY